MKHHKYRSLLFALAVTAAVLMITGCALPKAQNVAMPQNLTEIGNLSYDNSGNFYLDKSDPNDYGNSERYTILRIAEEMAEEKLPYYPAFKIHIGNGYINVEDKNAADSADRSEHYFVIKSAMAYGQTVCPKNFEGYELSCYGNLAHTVFDIDSHFVFNVTFSGTDLGYAYILGEEGVYKVETPAIGSNDDPHGFAEKTLAFYEDKGRLCFRGTTNKYAVLQSLDGIFDYCTSRDECYRDYGSVRFEESSMILTVERTETIEEKVEKSGDFEKSFEDWAKLKNYNIGIDEYLKNNSEKYPTGKADKKIVLSPSEQS